MADKNFYPEYAAQKAVEDLDVVNTFLVSNYFPTDSNFGIFPGQKVLVEYREENGKIAPFTSERAGAVLTGRDGYEAFEYSPANIAIKKVMTYDDLMVRGFGEDVYSTKDPVTRQQALLTRDMQDLSDRISRREELMAADVMLNNALTIADHIDGKTATSDDTVYFYNKTKGNTAKWSVAEPWGEDVDILAELGMWLEDAEEQGIAVDHILCAPDVARTIQRNKLAKEFFDNDRIDIGSLFPSRVTRGVGAPGTLNVEGWYLPIITYAGSYKDADGKRQRYLPSGTIILTSRNAGRAYYGGKGQINQGSSDFVSVKGPRMPKFLANENDDTRSVQLSSRPFFAPNTKNAFISANVFEETKDEDDGD